MNELSTPMARKPVFSTLGFACAEWAAFGIVAILCHLSRSGHGFQEAFAGAIVSITLLCGLFFPLLGALSPAPANGPKLLVFPAAIFLAALPWIPPVWLGDSSRRWTFILYLLITAVAGNLILLFVPGSGAAAAPRSKIIQWRAGGKLVLAAAATGLTLAVADLARPSNDSTPITYKVAAFLLLTIFSCFVTMRIVSNARAIVAALFLAVGGAVVQWILDPSPAVRALTPDACSGTALAIGAIYCGSHVARNSSLLWTAICIVLSMGSVAAFPAIGIPLLTGMVILTAAAAFSRQIGGAIFLAGAVSAVAFVISLTRDRFAIWLQGEGGPLSVAGLVVAGATGALALLAIIKLYKNATALALFIAGAASMSLAAVHPALRTIFLGISCFCMAPLAGALIAPRDAWILSVRAEKEN